jgi:hypothetical protein
MKKFHLTALKLENLLLFTILLALPVFSWGAPANVLAQAFLRPYQTVPARETPLEIILVASSPTPIQQVNITVPAGWTLTSPAAQSSVLKGTVSISGATITINYAQSWAQGSFDSITLNAKSPVAVGVYKWQVKLNNSAAEPAVPKTKSLSVEVTGSGRRN